MAHRKPHWSLIERHAARFIALAVIVATLTLSGTVSVLAQQQSEAETQTGESRTEQTAAVEVHVSECEPGYAGSDLFNDCHDNGLPDVSVKLTLAAGDTQTKATTQVQATGPGVVQFGNLSAGAYDVSIEVPGQDVQFQSYCSLADSDQVVQMSPENTRAGRLEVVDGQTVICDFYVIRGVVSDAALDSSDEATVTTDAVICPDGTDPDSNFDALKSECSEPLTNVTFTWGDAAGPLETVNSSASSERDMVLDEIVPGTYTLYSDVSLEFASERLFCVADDGNRYQKAFNDSGVTTFTDINREQIVCDWFVIPADVQGGRSATATSDSSEAPQQMATQDPIVTPTPANEQPMLGEAAVTPPTGGNQAEASAVRGLETGGSLVVHVAVCPEAYDGTAIFDTCHGTGVADQTFTLSGQDGSKDQTTTVPQSPGPGMVEFTGLAAGDYQLAGGPSGDFGRVELYCSTQPDGGTVSTSLNSTMASFSIGDGEDVLCDWYFMPQDAVGDAPAPTATAAPVDRAEILTTVFACEPGASVSGASYTDLASSCTITQDGVEFTLGDVGAPPLTASTGGSGSGAVRFYELLPGNYALQPSLAAGFSSAALFCQIDEGDWYQKTLTNGSATFVDLDGESIDCSWFLDQAAPQPLVESEGPSGSITVREFLCGDDQSKITDWERQCAAGSSGSTFALASLDQSLTRNGESTANGVLTFADLPDGFFTLEQQDGMWCKARAERVDSKSRVIVDGGQNTDVFLYHCSAVTALPSTGTGPAIGLLNSDSLESALTAMQLATMGGGVLGAVCLIVLIRRRRESEQP